MAKQKVEDRDLVTSREGVTVAFRLAPIEDRALKALVSIEQAEIDARGAPYRASAASVLRTLLRASAVAKGVWEPSSAPAANPPAAMTDEELNARLARARAALSPDHPRHPAQVRAQVLTTLTAISAGRDGHHKVIDLPTLKDALLGILSEDVNEALRSLEEDRLVTLKIANDPSERAQVPHPERGFVVPDRGLIYFVIMPEPKQGSLFGMTPAPIAQNSAPAPTPPAPKTTTKPELSEEQCLKVLRSAVAKGAKMGAIAQALDYSDGTMVGRWLREDELHKPISAEKLPKVRALIPALKKEYDL